MIDEDGQQLKTPPSFKVPGPSIFMLQCKA
jgi:hypothetical protein